MKTSLFGPCGLFCGACGATDCKGCLSDDAPDDTVQCRFRQCALKRHIDFCSFCKDYPCKELREFMNDEWPHHWTMEPNLQNIKKNGVETWLKAQTREWSCSRCGANIYWYQKACECGHQLDAWAVPE